MTLKMLAAGLCVALAVGANMPAFANHHEGGHAKPADAHGHAKAKPSPTPTPKPKAAKPADHGHGHGDGHGHGSTH
jgi:hypothetical protein